jgi:hypothetical protein
MVFVAVAILPNMQCLRCAGHGPTASPAAVMVVTWPAQGWKPLPLRNAKYWSIRAERARKIAEQMGDRDARLAMLEIARHYVILAENSPIVDALD